MVGRAALAASVARDLENNTLPGALRQMIRAGLPITAVLIAVHPIWGFSWYFNSENWATAAWQKIAETRVDTWRAAMIDAIVAAGGESDVAATGVFALDPAELDTSGDFSFVVIGDPGEGDQSQHALRDQVLAVGRKDEVKFVVIASDVVYPLGAMKDYEANFYLPLKGIGKPVFAVPGNHDWFNALDGFAANLMRPALARAAIEARVDADLSLSSTTDDRVDRLITDASAVTSTVRRAGGPTGRPVLRAAHWRVFAGGRRHGYRARRRRAAACMARRRPGSRAGRFHHGHSRPSVLCLRPRATRRRIVRSTPGLIAIKRCAGRDGRRYARLRVLP